MRWRRRKNTKQKIPTEDRRRARKKRDGKEEEDKR
jgi:hypothetical protein